MKKVLFAVLFISGVFTTQAQMKFGAKGGLNLASVKASGGGQDITSSSRTSIAVGAFGNFSVSDKFKIQPELLYAGLGGVEEGVKIKMDYLAIPVLGQFYATKKLYLQAGPQLGILLKAKQAGIDAKEFLRSTDLQLLFGGGFYITNKLSVDLRYGFSMGNIYSAEVVSSTDATGKNRALSFTLGYSFN
jgi:uncharacterized protein (UPF0303 family)